MKFIVCVIAELSILIVHMILYTGSVDGAARNIEGGSTRSIGENFVVQLIFFGNTNVIFDVTIYGFLLVIAAFVTVFAAIIFFWNLQTMLDAWSSAYEPDRTASFWAGFLFSLLIYMLMIGLEFVLLTERLSTLADEEDYVRNIASLLSEAPSIEASDIGLSTTTLVLSAVVILLNAGVAWLTAREIKERW